MREVARIRLPPHSGDGGFDHAAVDGVSDRLYVAHTSNDAVEVIDLPSRTHRRSLDGMRGVAGVWVDEASRLLFASHRGEDVASAWRITDAGEELVGRYTTGARPNGLAFDPGRRVLMVAGVGNPAAPNAPPTLTFVRVDSREPLGTLRMAGRTRWALYHAPTDRFYVNVADPPCVVAVAAGRTSEVERTYAVPARGPHGMEQDPGGGLLFVACDDGALVTLDVSRGTTHRVGALSGPPDVLWINPRLNRLYAAVGEPGCVDTFATEPIASVGRAPTGPDAHTLTVDRHRDELHVFLPGTCEDLVLRDDRSS